MRENEKKIVLITGCSSGLGFAAAKRFVEEGHRVYAGMRNLKNATVLEEAVNHSDQLTVVKLDITKQEDIVPVIDLILKTNERIDVLINNAAQVLLGPPDSATIEEVRELFEVNLFGQIRLTQAVIQVMRKQESGRIVFLSSISGVESTPHLSLYAASKFALEAIAYGWATTLHKWGIEVVILQPGAMNTNLPRAVKIGSFYKISLLDPYKEYNEKARRALKEALEGFGIAPEEGAFILYKAATEENPDLRYQTCDFSRDLVKNTLVDPQMTRSLGAHKKLSDDFFLVT